MPLKRLSALFLAVGLLLAVPGAAVRPAAYRLGRADDPQIPRILQAFTDVQYDAWYAESLAFVYQRSLLEGTSASTFSPQLPMSRAMGVTALYRHAGAPELAAVQAYQDVSPDDWYGPAAAWARESGVAFGSPEPYFAPELPLSREALTTLLWRYAGSPAPAAPLAGFTDQDQLSPWALDAVTWAVEIGLLTGDTPLTLSPARNITRAEAAVLLTRFCQQVIA